MDRILSLYSLAFRLFSSASSSLLLSNRCDMEATMTGAELRARRQRLGLSAREMHDEMMDILGHPRSKFAHSIMSRWETDKVKPPVWIALVVRLVEDA
jgi:hypothetical protein